MDGTMAVRASGAAEPSGETGRHEGDLPALVGSPGNAVLAGAVGPDQPDSSRCPGRGLNGDPRGACSFRIVPALDGPGLRADRAGYPRDVILSNGARGLDGFPVSP